MKKKQLIKLKFGKIIKIKEIKTMCSKHTPRQRHQKFVANFKVHPSVGFAIVIIVGKSEVEPQGMVVTI
jgi:hypothetical protein